MGMRGRDVLVRIELPLALPLIFAGIRTATVYVIATATLAAIAGGGGLGDIIVNQASYGIEGVIAGAMVVAGLAFAAELFFAGLQRLVTPRGLREAKREEDAAPLVGPAMEGST
jgi:osmoprotectant transport system permease protein